MSFPARWRLQRQGARSTTASNTPSSAVAVDDLRLEVSAGNPLGDVQRARLLHQAVQHAVTHGAVLESVAAHQAVISYRPSAQHRRHAAASACSLCAWASAWVTPVPMRMTRRRRLQLSIDHSGVITSRSLALTQQR